MEKNISSMMLWTIFAKDTRNILLCLYRMDSREIASMKVPMWNGWCFRRSAAAGGAGAAGWSAAFPGH